MWTVRGRGGVQGDGEDPGLVTVWLAGPSRERREGRRRRSERRGRMSGLWACLNAFGTCAWQCQRGICVCGSLGERPGLEIGIMGLSEVMQEKQ